jgi:hypothetical protein
MNQFGDNFFDLTLKGFPESFADLNIGSEQIANPGLWLTAPWTGFRPWTWPLIPRLATDFEARVRTLRDCLEQSIVNFFDIPEGIVESMPRSITEFFTGARDPLKANFKDFVMDSGNGLRTKDRLFSEESLLRIGAARISTWLESIVLPGQDILVDAPHLISRFPSLLAGVPDSEKSWNSTASLIGPSKLGIRYRTLLRNRFRRTNWLSRPAWYWSQASNNEAILEVENPWQSKRYGLRFCEDISRFLPATATKEFIAELPSPFVRRFVADASSCKPKELGEALRKITYRPAVRFFI